MGCDEKTVLEPAADAAGEGDSGFASSEKTAQDASTKTVGKQQFPQSGRAGIVLAALFLLMVWGSSTSMHGQSTDDKQALEKQVEKLTGELKAVQERLDALERNAGWKENASAQEATAQRDAAALKHAAAQAGPETPAQPSGMSAQANASARPGAVAQARDGAAPATRPGSTNPSMSGVNPAAVYNLTVGATQSTTAEQAKHRFFERKPGRDLSFYTKTGEITFYGNLDVSLDDATKGTRGMLDGNGNPPVGNVGWLEDISTNLAYVGVRGTQMTGIKDANFLYQLETSINISTAPGLHESNSQEQDTVDGTLFARNSYIGLGMVKYGALLIGKTDPPYKQSTSRMNPFSGMEGDYGVIMGNTGGDNRVEFGYRLDHSIWYSSPKLKGYQFNAFFSPGQNRAGNSDNIPAGEPDCNGGDNPGNGGLAPIACNDGSFSDVVSGNVSYTKEPFYMTAAYERHMKVNRQSDLTGIYSSAPPSNYTGPLTTNTSGLGYAYWVPTAFYNADVADEDAGKVGIQYGFFKKKTVVSAIVENMHRYVPGFLEWQNERQRLGSWLAGTQAIGAFDSLSIGWARAYRAPGDPCQHNDCFGLAPYSAAADGDATGGRGVDNEANLYTIAYRHRIGDGLEAYSDWAGAFNHPYAHFDLGAGGRGVTTDCHDASDAASNEFSNPHCWAGGHLKAFSVGLDKRF
jgi:predicted porin